MRKAFAHENRPYVLGVLFISIGILCLLDLTGVIAGLAGWAWSYWPALLILAGVAVLVRHPMVRLGVTIATAVILAVLLYEAFRLFPCVAEDGNGILEEYILEEPMDSAVHAASLRFTAGVGSFSIDGQTGDLVRAWVRSQPGRYALTRTRGDGYDEINLTGTGGRLHGKRYSNKVEVSLNEVPSWDIVVESGASRLNLDLANYNIRSMKVNVGAADVDLRLGLRGDDTHVEINGGASAVDVEVPVEAGCEVRFGGGLSVKSLSEFEKVNRRLYRTDNFGSAGRKILLDTDLGVSRFRVRRY